MILWAFLYTAWCRCPGGREAHFQQCGRASSHAPFAEPCGCQRVLFPNEAVMQLVRMLSTGAGVEGSEDTGGSFQTSSAVSGRRGADVPSSALHLCEQTM